MCHILIFLSKNNLDPHECLIVIDFKQNISLYQERQQIGQNWFETTFRTVFGAAIVYKDDGGEVRYHYMDVISSVLTHNAYFVYRALDAICQTAFFQEKAFTSVHFWMDNAKHFKNYEEFAQYSKLSEAYGFSVE